MAVHPIRIVGDPVLHHPVRKVETFDDELRTLVDDMFETMAAAHGVGLAANQIGVDLRVFVYDCPDDDGVRHRGVIVNPVLETSERPETMPDPDDDLEGCLSVPGESFPTGRAALGQGHRAGRRRQPDRGRGHRLLRPLPAARDRPPRRPAVPEPARRPVQQGVEAHAQAQRLGQARACRGTPARSPTPSLAKPRANAPRTTPEQAHNCYRCNGVIGGGVRWPTSWTPTRAR